MISKTYNKYLEQIKDNIEHLYYNTLRNEKNMEIFGEAAYREILSIPEKLDEFEDNFYDLSKIEKESNIVRHGDGATLLFSAQTRDFLDEYKDKKQYFMRMSGGTPIPGSLFNEIFNDNSNFWGYIADKPSDSSVELRMDRPQGANKIYLSTTHDLDVTLYAKSDYDQDYVALGTRSGREHVWNFNPANIAMLRFEANTNVFGIRYVNVSYCTYKNRGSFITKPHEIENLYKIMLDTDIDIPTGCVVKIYGIMDGERFELEDETIITGGVDFIEGEDIENLEENYIPDSIKIRPGYQEWDTIDTVDYVWSINQYDIIDGVVDIPESDIIPENPVQRVYAGTRDLILNQDYSYERVGNTLTFRVEDSSVIFLNEFPEGLKSDIRVREETEVKQVRTYVRATTEQDIYLDLPFDDPSDRARVRVVNIRDTIEHETLFEVDGTDSEITIRLRPGINLVEIEFEEDDEGTWVKYIPAGEMPDFDDEQGFAISDIDYFSNNFILKRVYSLGDVDKYSYYIDEDASEIVVHEDWDSTYVRYAKRLPINGDVQKIQLEFELFGVVGLISPTIRRYNIKGLL